MIWLNGTIVDEASPVVMPNDRGFLLGDGLFETIKISGGKPLFLAKHLARMHVAGTELGFPFNRHALRDGAWEYLQAMGAGDGSLRITVTRGPGPRGLSPVPHADQKPMAMMAFSPAPSSPPEVQDVPDRLVLAPFVRSSGAVSSRHKTLSYADNLAAIAHAREENAADVIFLNERGEVASTAMSNLFIRTGVGYRTPPLSAGILPGIVRSVLIEEAEAMGISIEYRPLKLEDLRDRLMFRTNSLLGVRAAWFDDGAGTLRPDIDEDEGLLARLYRLAEQREEGA